MPLKRRLAKEELKLDCEWGSCQESFSRMENLCKHAESHLGASDMPEEDEDEAEGNECLMCVFQPLPRLTYYAVMNVISDEAPYFYSIFIFLFFFCAVCLNL